MYQHGPQIEASFALGRPKAHPQKRANTRTAVVVNNPAPGLIWSMVPSVRICSVFTSVKQLQSNNPRLVQIHAGILIGSDALESGIHKAHELETGEGFAWKI
jgi:hypothetical protein